MSEKDTQESTEHTENTQVEEEAEVSSEEAAPSEEETATVTEEEQEELAIEDSESEVDDIEALQLMLAERDAQILTLTEALGSAEKNIEDLSSRLRAVSNAYKKEKEDQESFKERIQRQMEYRETRRRGDVVKILFEPLENLRRSHSSIAKADPDMAVGIEMVIKAFMKGFTDLGLEEIAPDGQKFNPNEHNALMMQPTQDPALDEVVLQTFSVGYRIEGLILQPAQVIIGRYDGPPIEETVEESNEESEETVELESAPETETDELEDNDETSSEE